MVQGGMTIRNYPCFFVYVYRGGRLRVHVVIGHRDEAVEGMVCAHGAIEPDQGWTGRLVIVGDVWN
jgi:hypothetical protein